MASFRLRRAEPGSGVVAFGALLVFVLLVYSNPGTLFFAGAGDVGIAKVAAGAGLLALGLSWLLRDRPLRMGGALGWMLAGFFALVGLSATWSLWPSMSVTTFVDGLKYFAIYLLVCNVVDRRGRARLLVQTVAWASVIPAVGAIWSWAHGQYLVEGDRAAWIGIFGNPNDLAYHLAVGIALALCARELTRMAWLRLTWLLAIGAMAAAILLTQSRGGLIATATVVGLWSIRGLRRGRTLVATGALALLAIYFAPQATWQRAETISDYQDDASAEGRIDAWRTGLNVAHARPLRGVGAGAFTLAWPQYAPGDAGAPRTSHNTFIQVIAETGVPSLLLFVGALLVGALGLSHAAQQEPRSQETLHQDTSDQGSRYGELATLSRGVQVGIGAFVVSSLTGGLAYTWPLYLLLGLASSLALIERVERAGAPAHGPEGGRFVSPGAMRSSTAVQVSPSPAEVG